MHKIHLFKHFRFTFFSRLKWLRSSEFGVSSLHFGCFWFFWFFWYFLMLLVRISGIIPSLWITNSWSRNLLEKRDVRAKNATEIPKISCNISPSITASTIVYRLSVRQYRLFLGSWFDGDNWKLWLKWNDTKNKWLLASWIMRMDSDCNAQYTMRKVS